MESQTKYGFDYTRSAVLMAPTDGHEAAAWIDLYEQGNDLWYNVCQAAAVHFGMDPEGADLESRFTVQDTRDIPRLFLESDGTVNDGFLTLLEMIEFDEIDEDDIERFLHWYDYNDHTGRDVRCAAKEWRQADWGAYPSLGAWLKANFSEVEPEVYHVMNEHCLLQYFDFEEYAYADYRFDFTLLDGHVYQDNI